MTGLAMEAFASTPLPAPARAPIETFAGVAALTGVGAPACNLHDRESRAVLLGRVAALVGAPALAPLDPAEVAAGDVLIVPGETLDRDTAPGLGPMPRRNLLGGLVPYGFVGSKAIAHGLVDADAARPEGWSDAMGAAVADCVIRGFSAFSAADALRAGEILLAAGPVRVKDVCGKAGLGQTVVRDAAALAALLAGEDPGALARHGIVIEENLTDVVTYSVGATELAGKTISYWGRQNLTLDHQGREVYGGSDLYVVRGDLDALQGRDLGGVLAEAVRRAARFDAAAQRHYPEAVLTRRNYDVIEGTAADGSHRVGVLEQSWRVGGATGAEIMAFEAFRADPDLAHVRCSTVEIYADDIPPADATVYFMGMDPVVGPMVKFAVRLD